MKEFFDIIILIAAFLVIVGWPIVLFQQRRGKKSKAGYIMLAIGSLIMAAYFIYLAFLK